MSDVFLEFAKLAQAVDANRVMVLKGVSRPSLADVEDWIQVTLVAKTGLHPRPTRWLIELICFSLHAELRTDKKIAFPHEMAELYLPLFQGPIKIIGSCFKCIDPNIVYLDNSTLGDSFQNVQITSPIAKTHAVVISGTFIETT
jgi:hypothetical protein